MGTPWFKMKDLAREHGILAFSSNYTLYGDMSNRASSILRDFSPDIEVYSIDESFLRADTTARLAALEKLLTLGLIDIPTAQSMEQLSPMGIKEGAVSNEINI